MQQGNRQQLKISVLNKSDLEGLSPEQRQFAEGHFRLIYAEQMSKLSLELSHKKKVLENLNTMDQQEEKNLKEQYEKLKNKMAVIEQKRNKRLDDKVKQYKLNDERWQHKLKEIQSKFKQKNREAMNKAKKYREESESFWKSKERKNIQKSRTHFLVPKAKSSNDVAKSLATSSINYSHFYLDSYKMGKNQTLNEERNHHSSNKTDNDAVDQQIKLHKQRSENIKRQKQELIFRNAIQKMERINKKREIIQKKHEIKPIEPTIPRRVDKSHRQLAHKKRGKRHSEFHRLDQSGVQQSKQSLQKLIKDHQQNKQKLEQQQFMQRGQIMDSSVQRNRREKILKMIKNRVHDMKVESLKKQSSHKKILI